MKYASQEDYEICRKLHRQYSATYYFASRRFSPIKQKRLDAIYAFGRVADEIVDDLSEYSIESKNNALQEYRSQLLSALEGKFPAHPVMRGFVDTLNEVQIPLEEPLLFLDSMEMDLHKNRYESYEELQVYMRGSASSLGVMSCYALDAPMNKITFDASIALGEALQLTNFLRDIKDDAKRGRIYLPQQDLETFDVSESDILEKRLTSHFKKLMKFQIQRARKVYADSDLGVPCLPKEIQLGVLLTRTLYSKILDEIERKDYDVFTERIYVSTFKKLYIAFKTILRSKKLQLENISI